MVDTVNLNVANVATIRSAAEVVPPRTLTSATDSSTPPVTQALPQAPYVSPYIYVDANYGRAVVQIRNSSNGEVVNQFPSEEALRAQNASAQQQHAEESAKIEKSTSSSASASPKPSTPPAAELVSAQSQAAATALSAAADKGATPVSTISITA